jgi:putative glutamine amidotransferase
MSAPPVIGVSAAFERARWAVWDDIEVNVSQRTYSDRIDAAGGVPLLLPASDAGTADPGALLDRVDALLLSGGADLDPAVYGQAPEPGTTNYRRARDEFEIALCRAAIDRRMPLLGVCRGMQVLNVARGGDLVQHVEGAETHLHTPGVFADHAVRLEPGSLAATAAGVERLEVRSHHHQGVGRLGEGLLVSGRSEPGEIVESIELPRAEGGWTLGILWHTEEEPGSAVMAAFVAAAESSRMSEVSA